VARGLKLRHDHGSNYMSGDFQDEIECLGGRPQPRRIRQLVATSTIVSIWMKPPCATTASQ
jgi:hypothetical protein